MYVRHTRSVQFSELPARVGKMLTEHAESRQIDLANVRLWMTRSENPPGSSGIRQTATAPGKPIRP
jgi:hypothetical protein